MTLLKHHGIENLAWVLSGLLISYASIFHYHAERRIGNDPQGSNIRNATNGRMNRLFEAQSWTKLAASIQNHIIHGNFRTSSNDYYNEPVRVDYGHALHSVSCLIAPQNKTKPLSDSRRFLFHHFPRERNAIRNGDKLVKLLEQKTTKSRTKRALSYKGKRVAFYTLFTPPGMVIASISADKTPIALDVTFEPPLKRTPPIITDSVILCVIKSIDPIKRIIHVVAKPSEWIVMGTG